MKLRSPLKKAVSKYEADNCLKLSIFKLGKRTLYDGGSDTIKWSYQSGESFEVGLSVVIDDDRKYLRLFYTDASLNEGGMDVDFNIHLTTTPCNYGGRRWWFLCPLIANGKPCHKRVGVLYKPPYSDYFGCRKCFNLTYQSSKLSGWQKRCGKLYTLPELAELQKQVKRGFYRGEITKKYKTYLNRAQQMKRYSSSFKENLRKELNSK